MSETNVRIEGLDKLLKKVEPGLLNKPLRNFFKRATITVQNRARDKAPVDTGRLRSSIATEVDRRDPPKWGKVGTNVKYAPFVEFGTRPHWPPPGALQPWARRHGFPTGPTGDFLVRRAIARRGTRAQPYLKPALEKSVGDIKRFLSRMADEIEAGWGS